MGARQSRWSDAQTRVKTEKLYPTAVGGRPAWPRCPHTWLAGLDAHRLEASGENGRVGHIGVQALLLAPVHKDHHNEQQSQTQSHSHHPHVQRHVFSSTHSCTCTVKENI